MVCARPYAGMLCLVITSLCLLALANPASAVGFGGDKNYAVPSFPYSVTAADVTGDGKVDLVTPDTDTDTVSVLRGEGDGTFGAPKSYRAGDRPRTVATGDFNEDGAADLAVANRGSNDVSVLLGENLPTTQAGTEAAVPSGTFAPARTYGAGAGPRTIIARDLDGDGNVDLAVVNRESDDVSILLGTGDGTFQAATNYPAGDNAYDVVAANFDGDPVLDLAIVNRAAGTVSILKGDSAGGFVKFGTYSVGGAPFALATADFDGDDKADLAVGNVDAKRISILGGGGDGTFETPKPYGIGTFAFDVEAEDFNGDGRPDLAVANNPYQVRSFDGYAGSAAILMNNGDGTLAKPVDYGAGVRPVAVATGDFDGDAKPDLVVANKDTDNLSVMLQGATGIDVSTDDPLVTFGEDITLSGKLTAAPDGTPLAGREVVIEERPWAGDRKDRFTVVGRVTTAEDGSYSLAGVEPRWTSDYRARFAGDGANRAATTDIEVTSVKVKVSLGVSDALFRLGGGTTFFGAVAPEHHEMTAVLRIERNGKPFATRKVFVDHSSRFRYTYEPPYIGRYSAVLSFPNHPPGHLANASNTKTFRVVR